MILNLSQLKKIKFRPFKFNKTFNFNEKVATMEEIISINDIIVIGEVNFIKKGQYLINLKIKGMIYLPCAITLEPVQYKINLNIKDFYTNDKNIVNSEIIFFDNQLNITEIIWANIYVSLPMKIKSKNCDYLPKEGKDYIILDDYQKPKRIHPEFIKLKRLFDEDDEKK